jgi:transcriptional regulator with XRE-family HTH domain
MTYRGDVMTKKEELALFIASKIKASRRTQREIARDAGIPNSNFLSMIKTGDAKIPMSRVPSLADALGVPRAELLRRVLEADHAQVLEVLDAILSEMPVAEDEIALMRAYRFLKLKGIIDAAGCEIRGLGKKGRASGWARISKS